MGTLTLVSKLEWTSVVDFTAFVKLTVTNNELSMESDQQQQTIAQLQEQLAIVNNQHPPPQNMGPTNHSQQSPNLSFSPSPIISPPLSFPLIQHHVMSGYGCHNYHIHEGCGGGHGALDPISVPKICSSPAVKRAKNATKGHENPNHIWIAVTQIAIGGSKVAVHKYWPRLPS